MQAYGEREKEQSERRKFGPLEHLKNFTQRKTWLQLSSITASLLKTVADSLFYFTHPSCPPALWSASFLCCASCQWAVTGTVWACKDTHTGQNLASGHWTHTATLTNCLATPPPVRLWAAQSSSGENREERAVECRVFFSCWLFGLNAFLVFRNSFCVCARACLL